MPSKEHDELVEMAAAWLTGQGFTEVLIEAKVVVVGELKGSIARREDIHYGYIYESIHGTTRTPDVIGFNNKRRVIIECGSVMRLERLSQFQDLGFEVYIWPYDTLEPYLWSGSICLCKHCGRKFEHTNFYK